MNTPTKIVFTLCLLFGPQALFAQQQPADPIVTAMRQELDRSMQDFKKTSVPPYFLSYELTDNRAINVSAAFGTLISTSDRTTRVLDVDLRVGDYKLDSTHPLRQETFSEPLQELEEKRNMPLDDDPLALKVALWQATEGHYRRAVERLQQVQANVQVKVAQEDQSPDFSHENPHVYSEPIAGFSVDEKAWEQRLRNLTNPFAEHKEILDASAQLDAEIETRRYVNSDGTELRMSTPFYRLIISATAKADDGMELPLYQTYMSFRPDGLPDEAALAADVSKMIDMLLALTKAPLAEPYTGPAILSLAARARSSFMKFLDIVSRANGRRTRTTRRRSREK